MNTTVAKLGTLLNRIPGYDAIVAWFITVSQHGDHFGHPWF